MDHRSPLKLNTVLTFKGMSCHIEEVIGQGSNAIVYKGWYQDSLNRELRHHVLVKELFPKHPGQKIYRAENDRILVEPEAEDFWKNHKESFEAGNRIHLRLLNDHPDLMVMGANLNSFQGNGTLYSVLGYAGGRSLEAELNKRDVSLRHTALRMIGLLDALEAFHKSGYLHLDISPDNIMLVGQEDQERMFLIDYNSVREPGALDGSTLSRKAGYSAPEVIIDNPYLMGFSTDLYSVAAVFFRCIMGRSLTQEEAQQKEPPAGQDSPALKDMPQTVRAMVGRILQKGLQSVAGRRYRSIGQMRQAFQELLDRIDCVGVTHWSLWENGKRSVEELIRINPSLRYLKEERKLYPIRLEQEYSMSLERYLDNILSPAGKSGMILAQGGMGKTTLLLHTAMLRGARYSPVTPAVFYVSLNGWDKADTHYIRSQILMRLKFKKEENTFDSAMHALHKLLEQPIKTKQGDVPTVLLLLDGLNEVRGDIAPLVQEINELNKMAGVRILATSRTAVPELELETVKLMPLYVEDIEVALGRNGLLIPRKQEVIQLLRTPLILSIYIQASEGGKQLDVETEEELMRAYMDSLLEKEIRDLPEDSPLRWQIDVALNYVLPAIAAEVKKKGRALTEQQMLKIVETCWKTLRSPLLKRVFPQWIGHTKDIFAGAKTAEVWFGILIHMILYQKQGFLVKNHDNQYHIFHQSIGDYLASSYRDKAKRIRRRKTAGILFVVFILILLVDMKYGFTSDVLRASQAISEPYWDCYHLSVHNAEMVSRMDYVLDAASLYAADPTPENLKEFSYRCNVAFQEIDKKTNYMEGIESPSRMEEFFLSLYNIDLWPASCMYAELSGPMDFYGPFPFVDGTDRPEYASLLREYLRMIDTMEELALLHNEDAVSLEVLSTHVKKTKEVNQLVFKRSMDILNYYTLELYSFITPESIITIENTLASLGLMETPPYSTVQEFWDQYLVDSYILAEVEKTLAALELEKTPGWSTDQKFLYQQIVAANTQLAEYNNYWRDLYDQGVLDSSSSIGLNFYSISDYRITKTITLPSSPPGLQLPNWIHEDQTSNYWVLDPFTQEMVTYAPEESCPVAPFAWYTVCYGITKEEVFRYLETFDEETYYSSWSEDLENFTATINCSDACIVISWVPGKVTILATGFQLGY